MRTEERDFIRTNEKPVYVTVKQVMMFIMAGLFLSGAMLSTTVDAQPVPPFKGSLLVKLGDEVKYGSYIVRKIGEGVYQLNDPGVTTGKSGAFGVDMYLVCGEKKALMIDLGNNYIDGYENNLIAPRTNAAEELREVVYSLAGSVPLEIAITHAHPDHDGMTGAFINRGVTIWMPEGEDITAPQTQHKIDPSVYSLFKQGEKTFDLGEGRIIETFLVRGHSLGGTVYISRKDQMLFTSDALGSGIGQGFGNVERLRMLAEDSQKLVEYIKSSFTPYERYGIRVYTGHWWQNSYGGFMSPNKGKVDVGYLDWRFVQDVASCANGILQGKWLVEGSGLQYVGKMAYYDSWPSAEGRAIMLYGTGTVILPLEVAYEAAGLKMPVNETK